MWGGQAAAKECAFYSTQSPARKHHLHVQNSTGRIAGKWEERENHVVHMSREI